MKQKGGNVVQNIEQTYDLNVLFHDNRSVNLVTNCQLGPQFSTEKAETQNETSRWSVRWNDMGKKSSMRFSKVSRAEF